MSFAKYRNAFLGRASSSIKQKLMGNSTEPLKTRILLVESQLVGRLHEEIQGVLSDNYDIQFVPIEQLQERLTNDISQHVIAECEFKQKVEKAIEFAGVENVHKHFIKKTMEPVKYLEELRATISGLMREPSPCQELHRSLRTVTVKFVDRNVHSPHYELFLNYMKNRDVSYELHQTIADFVQSQKKTRCEYIIASAQFADFMFDGYPKVYCFCNRSQELNGKFNRTKGVESEKQRVYESNFTRIIKLLLSDRRKSTKQTIVAPVKVLAVWKRGLNEQTFSQLARRKVQCRFIAADELNELVEVARKSLYTTVVVHGQEQWRDFEDAVYNNHLEGRVYMLSCVRGRHQLFKSLDQHLDRGYELVEKRVRCITFIGDTPYLEKMRCLEHLLFAEGVKVELIEPQKFMLEPYQPLVAVTPVQLLQRIGTFMKKMSFSSIVMSLNLEYGGLDQQRESQNRKHISRILKELDNKILYVENGDYSHPRLHGILKDLHELEKNRHLFLEVEEMGDRSSTHPTANYTAKFTNLRANESSVRLLSMLGRLWKLEYNPVDNYHNLLQDLQMSIRRLVRLKLLRLNTEDMEQYLNTLKQCSSFASLVEAVLQLYLTEQEICACLKQLMASIDKYVDCERVELLKPLVVSIMCATCGLFRNPNIEPIIATVRLGKSRLEGLQNGNRLINHQFIEAELKDIDSTSRDQQVMEITYCPVELPGGQFYSGVRISKRRMVICPHTELHITELVEDKRGTIVRVQIAPETDITFLQRLVEANTQILGGSPIDLFGRHRQFATQSEQPFIRNRLTLYKYLSEMRQQRYFRARYLLECYRKEADYVDQDLIESAYLYLNIADGELVQATNIIEQITDQNKLTYWSSKLERPQQTEFKTLSIFDQKQVSTKWVVRFCQQEDTFELEDLATNELHNYQSNLRLNALPSQHIPFPMKLLPGAKKTRMFALSVDSNILKMQPDKNEHFKSTLSTYFENPNSRLVEAGFPTKLEDIRQTSDVSANQDSPSNSSRLGLENMDPQGDDTIAQLPQSSGQSDIQDQPQRSTQQKPRKRHKVVRKIYRMR